MLTFQTPIKSFSALQLLCLYGFAIKEADFPSFIQSFPVLKSLELHHMACDTSGVRSASLRKLFWWGEVSASIDLDNSATSYVPGSLGMLLSCLLTGEEHTKKRMVHVLEYLVSSHAANQKAIVWVPGIVQELLSLFSVVGHDCQCCILRILAKLSQEAKGRQVLTSQPKYVKSLVDRLDTSQEVHLPRHVATILLALSCDADSQKKIASLPKCIRSLVRFALQPKHCWHQANLQQQMVEILFNLTAILTPKSDVEKRDTCAPPGSLQEVLDQQRVARLPGFLEGLLDVMQCGIMTEQRSAFNALSRLVATLEDMKAVAAVPGCIEKLVDILGDASLNMQAKSARILLTLAEDKEAAKGMAQVPECVQRLVYLLQNRKTRVAEAAAWVLYRIALDPENRKTVAAARAVVSSLVGLLYGAVQEGAAAVLSQIALETGSRSVIACTPGSLRRLNDLLACGNASVRERVAQVFCGLVEDCKVRKTVATLPGVFRELAELLGAEGSVGTQCAAAGALERLTVDTENAELFAPVPRAVPQLVALLGAECLEVQSAAVQILGNLSVDSEALKTIAGVPGGLHQLVFLSGMGPSRDGIAEAAVKVLQRLTTDSNIRAAVVACPGGAEAIAGARASERTSASAPKPLWSAVVARGPGGDVGVGVQKGRLLPGKGSRAGTGVGEGGVPR